jgi:uncharacterized protein (DUF2384 family)
MSRTIDKVIYARAAALLKKGWTSNGLARNAKGRSVSPYSKTAVKFCAVGAIVRATYDVCGDEEKAETFLMRAIKGNEHLYPESMRLVIEERAR